MRLRCPGHALNRIGRQTLYKKEKIGTYIGDTHSLTYDLQSKTRAIMKEEKAIMLLRWQRVITTDDMGENKVDNLWLSHHQIIGNIATGNTT